MAARIEKEVLERKIAADLLRHVFKTEVHPISASPPEPDVYATVSGRTLGIELCALLDQSVIEATTLEKKFLEEVNARLDPAEWSGLSVRLVMQDDRDTIVHRPAERFARCKLLPAYLDALFVYRESVAPPFQTVMLNQWSSHRPVVGLFPKPTEISSFVAELQQYVSGLTDADFGVSLRARRFHHAVVAEKAGECIAVPKEGASALSRKLKGSTHYEMRNDCGTLWLLIHNLPQSEDQEVAFAAWHSYWHHREAILEWVRAELRNGHGTQFERVYFADYSECLGACRIHDLTIAR